MKEPVWKLPKKDKLKTFMTCTNCKKLKHRRNFPKSPKAYRCKLCIRIYLHGTEKLCRMCNKTKKIASFAHKSQYCKPCSAGSHKRNLIKAQKDRDGLSDSYVRSRIVSVSGLRNDQITAVMIEGYRDKLLLMRILHPKWGRNQKKR